MEIKAIETVQNGSPLYLASMPAGDLVEISEVDIWSPSNQDGYQRELQRKRVAEASKYLVKGEALFPTSVLLSVRSTDATFTQAADANGSGFGVLKVPDGEKLWIVDGQHRLAALADAIDKGHAHLADYPVLVTIFVNPDRFEEMRWFYLVNSRQRRVPTEVAVRHLERAYREKGTRWLLEQEDDPNAVLKSQAVQVVDLMQTDCKSWKNMIVLPTEKKPGPNAVKANTIISSLMRSAMKQGVVRRRAADPTVLAELLCRYWDAVARVFPEAFAEPGEHSIQRTPGLYSLHAIFPDVLELCQDTNDFSEDRMFEVLDTMRSGEADAGMSVEIDSGFWSKDSSTGDPMTFGTGLKSINLLAEYLRSRLPKPRLDS